MHCQTTNTQPRNERFDAERLGWLSLLAHWWERRFDVVNRGFSGYNTRWLMPLMDRLFVPGGNTPVKLVTIFLGANDCVLPGNAQYGACVCVVQARSRVGASGLDCHPRMNTGGDSSPRHAHTDAHFHQRHFQRRTRSLSGQERFDSAFALYLAISYRHLWSCTLGSFLKSVPRRKKTARSGRVTRK